MTPSPLHRNELHERIVQDATAASNQRSTIHSPETHQYSSEAKKGNGKLRYKKKY
jgi:hypothetical protein